MKSFEELVWKSKRCLKKHSPTILSSIAAVGVVTSTVTAIKATPKAIALLKTAEDEKQSELTKIEIVRAAAPAYIPTAIACVSTIICIFGANVLNKKQQASLISTYALLDDTFKKYRKAAINIYGNDADTNIKAEMAKMAYVSCDGYSIYNPDMDFDSEQLLFYDFFAQRYFNTTLAAVINAQYHLNRNLMLRGYVTLNEFYDFLGIEQIKDGDDLGWNMDYLMTGGYLWLDFKNEHVKMEDGMECCIISPFVDPMPFSVIDEEMYS